ncbi:hypothetical protein PCE1_001691 [Barthelona sp. PCE]
MRLSLITYLLVTSLVLGYCYNNDYEIGYDFEGSNEASQQLNECEKFCLNGDINKPYSVCMYECDDEFSFEIGLGSYSNSNMQKHQRPSDYKRICEESCAPLAFILSEKEMHECYTDCVTRW